MNYLAKKMKAKRIEVAALRQQRTIKDLVKSPLFNRPCISLSSAIQNGGGLITEFKRQSPSAGPFNLNGQVKETLLHYESNQASGHSVLTDMADFGGGIEDILNVRAAIKGPILRKDFIVDEYQIFEAKAIGADAILLIADGLDDFHCENLTVLARSIGLEVLMEFHSKAALRKLNAQVSIIGINNRDLKTLKTDLNTAHQLIKYLPYERVKIAESGIQSSQDMKCLIEAGYDGLLVGEYFLKEKGSVDMVSLNETLMGIKMKRNEA